MSENTFKPGDQVRLRSGGPVMSVALCYEGWMLLEVQSQAKLPMVSCVLFDKEDHAQRGDFPAECLERHEQTVRHFTARPITVGKWT